MNENYLHQIWKNKRLPFHQLKLVSGQDFTLLHQGVHNNESGPDFFCGKVKIKSLNNKYRQINKATDVLSFPIFENLRPDKKVSEKNLPQIELGDLVICKELAKTQAVEFKISYEQEVIHLAVHGFLHLLGFDHEVSSKEEKIMEKLEAELVNKIYKKLK